MIEMRNSLIILTIVAALLLSSTSTTSSLSDGNNSIPIGAHILLEHHVYKNGTAYAFASISTPGKIEVKHCLFLINIDIIITDERRFHAPYYIMSRWGWGVSLDDRDIVQPRGIPTIMGPFSHRITHHLNSVVWAPLGDENYTFEFAAFILCPQTEKISIALGNLTVILNSSSSKEFSYSNNEAYPSNYIRQPVEHSDNDTTSYNKNMNMVIVTNPAMTKLFETISEQINSYNSNVETTPSTTPNAQPNPSTTPSEAMQTEPADISNTVSEEQETNNR
ncbi:MAG: hypothetical protein J7K13_05510 [Thermoplasmata archaeon]|nr:hypothetical protein [Thermoplasmata archaeon]